MERGSSAGGCCIARYTHPNPNTTTTATPYPYYNAYDMTKMDRIMLRFRPIAPKPTTSGPTTTPSASNDNVKAVGKRKRKNNNNNKGGSGSNNGSASSRRRKSRSPDDQKSDGLSNGEESSLAVTLPLLPETPDLCNNNHNTNYYYHHEVVNNNVVRESIKLSSMPKWLCFGSSDQDQTVTVAPEVVGSSVIVEGVTDTWVDGNGLGRTDEERRRRLEEDMCPGFLSDRWNRVWWTNEGYRRMVAGEHTWRKGKEVVVRLGMKEKVELPAVNIYPAFTCRVRVQYGSHSMTVPCDAWRMNCGGFAWRLDVKAALTLSL